MHEIKYSFKNPDLGKVESLIEYFNSIIKEKAEEASNIKQSFFIKGIKGQAINTKDLTFTNDLKKSQAQASSVFPVDLGIHNNDFSEKLLEGINQNLKEIQINIGNSARELRDQGSSIKTSTLESENINEEVRLAEINIDELSSKKRCQVILMYLTSIILSVIIVLLLVFKFTKY